MVLVGALALATWLPSPARAATPHLTDKKIVKQVLACQKAVQTAGAAFITLRRLRVAQCADAVLNCTASDQTCREKAQRSKKIAVSLAKCEVARLKCSANATATCNGTMARLVNGANVLDVKIRSVKSCGAVSFPDLTSTAGLDFGALAPTCQHQFGLTVDGLVPLSQCIVRQYACQADRLIEAEIPRARELLRTAGVSAANLDAVAPCLEDHAGAGALLATSTQVKTVTECDARFRKSSKNFSAIALTAAGTCLNEVLKCVQSKPDNGKCLASATAKCNKAVARVALKGDAAETAIVGKDATCSAAFADLAGAAGANRQAISCACDLAGVHPVTDLAGAARCVRRVGECRLAKILPFAVPRAAELLQLVGLTPADLLCSFDGAVPFSRVAGRALGRALSRAPRPSIPTIRNLLTGAGNGSGQQQTAKTGSKPGSGGNGARALAARHRFLRDSSGRVVARYAKRNGVSLTLIGVVHDNTPKRCVGGLNGGTACATSSQCPSGACEFVDASPVLDGYFDVSENPATDETEDSETHLVLDYANDVTTCAFELGVMIGDDTGLSAPVSLGQQVLKQSNTKLLDLQQVEQEDVPDDTGNPVHGLEGDQGPIVVSPDGQYVYAAGASNTIGFCSIPEDPALPFCGTDSDCSPSGRPCIRGVRKRSDALVSFKRDHTGHLRFAQTVSFGPDAAEPELRISATGNPLGITVSPDNSYIYIVLTNSQTIVVLKRGPNDDLSFTQKIVGSNADQTPPQLQSARAPLVSPDGHNVYIAVGTLFLHDPPPPVDERGGVVVMRATDGILSYVESKVNGADDVPAQTLSSPTRLAMDPEGKSLYVAALGDSALTVLQRDPVTGALTFVDSQRNLVGGVSGLTNVRDVAVSPDGKFVYTVSFADRSVATFARNMTNGALTFIGTISTGPMSDNPWHPTRLVVSPDGKYVYVAGGSGITSDGVDFPDATLNVFARDLTTGDLTYIHDAGGNGLGTGFSVAVSPDSMSVYVTTQLHASVGSYRVNSPPP